jgi:hypothetical protein
MCRSSPIGSEHSDRCVSAQIVKTGWHGFGAGDVRFGEKLEGTAINGGIRYQ